MSLTGTQVITETGNIFTFGPDATSCAAGEQVPGASPALTLA